MSNNQLLSINREVYCDSWPYRKIPNWKNKASKIFSCSSTESILQPSLSIVFCPRFGFDNSELWILLLVLQRLLESKLRLDKPFRPTFLEVIGSTFTTGRIWLIWSSLITRTGRVLPCSEPMTGSRLARKTCHLKEAIYPCHSSKSTFSNSLKTSFRSLKKRLSFIAFLSSLILLL